MATVTRSARMLPDPPYQRCSQTGALDPLYDLVALSDPRRFSSQVLQLWHNRTTDGGIGLNNLPPWGFNLTGQALLLMEHIALAPTATTQPASTGRETRPLHLAAIDEIRNATGLSNDDTSKLLGVSRQTLNLWNRGNAISIAHRSRVLAVHDILERAKARHATREQLLSWLYAPCEPSGRTPAVLLSAGELDQARFYSVASSSPGLPVPPVWTNHPADAYIRYAPSAAGDLPAATDDDRLLEQYGEPGSTEVGTNGDE